MNNTNETNYDQHMFQYQKTNQCSSFKTQGQQILTPLLIKEK